MTPERWRQVQAVFHDALERAAPERRVFLDGACGGDAELYAAVESMLAADEDASAVCGAVPASLSAVLFAEQSHASAVREGQRVGPYAVIGEVGRGGMGAVYLARRDDVGKTVALKLVRGGLAAPERVERLLVERRVLARLDHPHIARLLDAGVADDGTPFFAMEYVEGEPLDQYCDRRRLSVPERLRLFERVCEAVQYAHRNLVVHRDLKPSNILVTEDGTPKLLDFGIAKLLAEEASEAAEAGLTVTGVRLMTPEYAAPEQLRGEPVTTATDVYSLGVLLYELLAGRRPYEARGAGPAELERLVLEREPPRPSSVVRREGATTAAAGGDVRPAAGRAVAAARGTSPERLRRQLAGDLDTIVLKALEKEPARRYASADQLLDDLRRHRDRRPVRARPDTLGYRARRFVRRHRLPVAAAALLVVLLAGVAVMMTYQQARTAQALARAEAEAAKARQVTRFLTTIFSDFDPFQPTRAGAGGGVVAGEPLRFGIERVEREFADQPDVRAQLLHTLGAVDKNLGRYDEAERLLRRGVVERRRVPGVDGRADTVLASLWHDLGVVLRLKNDYRGADEALARALAMRRALLGATDPDVAATLYQLGTLRRYQARYDEAERLLDQAIAIQRQRPPGPELADALEQLSNLRRIVGDPSGAEPPVREAVSIRERVLGPDHPAVASALGRLSLLLLESGRLEEAEQVTRQALAIQRRRLAADHPEVLYTLSDLSLILRRKGELAAGERLQREVLAARRRIHGDTHRDVAGSLQNLGNMLRWRGDLAGADATLRRSMGTYARVMGPDHPDVHAVLADLAIVLHQKGDEEGAARLAARVIAGRGEDVWDRRVQGLGEVASRLREHGECARAEPLLRETAAIAADSHPQRRAARTLVARMRSDLGACLMSRRRHAEAEPLLSESYAVLRRELGDEHRLTREARRRMDALRQVWPTGGR